MGIRKTYKSKRIYNIKMGMLKKHLESLIEEKQDEEYEEEIKQMEK
jgi:hypothetical protein